MANEYSVNQSDLVSVANAIREKGGTSETLVFPDGFVGAVQAIQAAGGGSGNFATGTFTTTDDITSNVVINHNLGVKPKFIMVLCTYLSTYTGSKEQWLSFYYLYQLDSTRYGHKYQSPNSSTIGYATGIIDISDSDDVGGWYRVNVDETTFTLKQATISSTYGIGASKSFFWIAYGG